MFSFGNSTNFLPSRDKRAGHQRHLEIFLIIIPSSLHTDLTSSHFPWLPKWKANVPSICTMSRFIWGTNQYIIFWDKQLPFFLIRDWIVFLALQRGSQLFFVVFNRKVYSSPLQAFPFLLLKCFSYEVNHNEVKQSHIPHVHTSWPMLPLNGISF